MQLGESFTVQNDWATARTTSSDSPMPNAVRFLPATTASAILLKYVRNRITPFYVAGMRTEPLPPGKYTLTPSGNVRVFFMAQEACSAFKVTNIPTRSYLFRYQGQSPSKILYNSQGQWQLLSGVDPNTLPEGGPPPEDKQPGPKL
jgi:hypothetical protein